MELTWNSIDIEVLNHNKRYKQKRIKLVSNACGHAKEGLLAVMGPSGSGKTTLLQALAGRIVEGSSTTGSITLDGQERNIKTWKNLVGVVDQDDAIYERLTARETVTYAAKFRLKDKSIDIKKKIDDLFKKLAITHVLDCQMANLSGGERKRVMIAIELITDPKIIFLDEPTSGLDNNTTVKIVRLLKELSKEGRIIIFTIHQPDDITVEEFDEIFLLSQGRSVYMGKMANCEKHLVSNGFVREPKESMSNFAMKVLSVEPGVYHETADSSKLDILVNEVKEKYSFSEVEKHTKKSNDKYTSLIPNFNHTMLLLKRRFKLELFSKKNILTLLWGFLLIGALVLMLIQTKKHFVKNFNSTNVAKIPDASKVKYTKLNDDGIVSIGQNLSVVFGGFLIAFLPITTGTAFNQEHGRVKREVAVNTYSITSYFLSAFLFELIKGMPALIIGMSAFRIVAGKCIDMLFIFTFLFSYVTTIAGYLFCGSLFRGLKKIMLIFCVFLLFNAFPVGSIIVVLKKEKKLSENFIMEYLLNLMPNYVLITALSVTYTKRFFEKYKSFFELNAEAKRAYDENKNMMRLFKKLLIGIEAPIFLNYICCLFLFLAYIALCVTMLSVHLKPNYRMSLNKSGR